MAAALPLLGAGTELSEEALEEIINVLREAKGLGEAIARDAGLTAENDYIGWLPVLILLYRFVYPPLKLLVEIEGQLSGVLEAAYAWFGGAGRSLDRVETEVKEVGPDVVHFFEHL